MSDEHVQARARQLIGLLDLTTLNRDDTDETVARLCSRALTQEGPVAAVCVWPRFIRHARHSLPSPDIRIAAVTNFPDGGDVAAVAARETEAAIELGADEVDVVFPYHAWLWGNRRAGARLVGACKSVCGSTARLKVILETGALVSADHIRDAARTALDNGADFIKTSTGKSPVSATPEAARVMLEVIHAHGSGGFKASGGIRDLATAITYVEIAEEIMGAAWLSAETFRFGASGLLDALLEALGEKTDVTDSTY